MSSKKFQGPKDAWRRRRPGIVSSSPGESGDDKSWSGNGH
jgi:hypothetical protein